MLRTKAFSKKAIIVAVGATCATLLLSGCDRPSTSQSGSARTALDSGIAKPIEKSANRSVDQPAEKLTEAGKAADTGTTVVAAAHDDLAINAKVSSALMADSLLKSASIKVDTKDGVVTLSGSVATAEMRNRAKEVAARQSGVVSVIDNMAAASHG